MERKSYCCGKSLADQRGVAAGERVGANAMIRLCRLCSIGLENRMRPLAPDDFYPAPPGRA
jgi:hypothetical protein